MRLSQLPIGSFSYLFSLSLSLAILVLLTLTVSASDVLDLAPSTLPFFFTFSACVFDTAFISSVFRR